MDPLRPMIGVVSGIAIMHDRETYGRVKCDGKCVVAVRRIPCRHQLELVLDPLPRRGLGVNSDAPKSILGKRGLERRREDAFVGSLDPE